MIAEENEILKQEREAILADWRRYYSNQFDKNSSSLANLPIPIEADSPPNSPAPSLNLSPKFHPMARMKSLLNRIVKRPRTHTSLSIPTGGEDHTSEYQLTAEDVEGDLYMTVREDKLDEKGRPLIDWVKPVEWLLPNAELYEEWKEYHEKDQDEDGNGSEDSDRIYSEERIYKEEEKEEEETDYDGDNGNDDNYHEDGEREWSSDSLSQSENGDVDIIEAGEISGSSLGRASCYAYENSLLVLLVEAAPLKWRSFTIKDYWTKRSKTIYWWSGDMLR
ncbi:hypothetical protein B9Z19DRAFT_1138801 [Tuber borchii]|uniref:Uncharacterized protein n=1 Tax=Tuber borchii TaxID=42251 RepID=A0A2T6Z9M1_TUBBO|nr:hypothetical protein B9Z19DRAFT_1138801 [Tuber borchii]